MSDLTKFMNVYVDYAVGMIHENTSHILQLKTQLKMANDLISEKDAVIGSLTTQLESSKAENQEMNQLRQNAARWETAHNTMVGKVSHLDTALSQIAQMKKEIQIRDETIEVLKASVKKLNTKKRKLTENNEPPDKPSENDF